jgi:hypothetical protein
MSSIDSAAKLRYTEEKIAPTFFEEILECLAI